MMKLIFINYNIINYIPDYNPSKLMSVTLN